jgi:hypothetical protein
MLRRVSARENGPSCIDAHAMKDLMRRALSNEVVYADHHLGFLSVSIYVRF